MNSKTADLQKGMVIVEQCSCGGDRNFGYILADGPGGSACVIDPSPDPTAVIEHLAREHYSLKGIVCTHNHPDHTGGIDLLGSLYKVPVIGHLSNSRADLFVSDGEEFLLGDRRLRFFHTPGHSADSICILFHGHLFSGDTLFVGKVGGTANPETALAQFDSLQRLMDLDDAVMVWPGHDYGMSSHSTIGEERRNNPFILRLGDFSEFLRLKANWQSYQREHGIN